MAVGAATRRQLADDYLNNMTFSSIKELTSLELVALAFVEFGHNRFTSNRLITHLCAVMAEPFKVSSVTRITQLLNDATANNLVQPAPGPRGGPGYQVSASGAEAVAEVVLPRDKFEAKDALDNDRMSEASGNPGPVFTKLLAAIPARETRDRHFIGSVAQHWLTRGWLSRKQVTKMAAIAARHGEFVEERPYVGRSMDEWRAPYIQEQERRIAEARAVQEAYALAAAARRREKERIKKNAKDRNDRVKRALKAMESHGRLSELEALIAAVFPAANPSAAAKAVAFAGHGSKELRTCIAAVAFHKPPAQVWANSGSAHQPDADSEMWQKVISHPAYRSVRHRLDPVDLDWLPSPGDPAVEVTDVPKHRDGRHMKKVILVCPECSCIGIWIENPDTSLRCFDHAEECDRCGYGY